MYVFEFVGNKMKVLIINPPDENTVVEHPDEKGIQFLEGDDFGEFPPLGAVYVLSYLEKKCPGFQKRNMGETQLSSCCESQGMSTTAQRP